MMRAFAARLRTEILGRLATGRPPARGPLARRLQGREERLFSALGGAMSFEILRTAYDVGIFRLLHERPGLGAEEIAQSLGLGPYPTRVLLLGLVPMGLVERADDRYWNDPILSGLLSGADDGGLRPIIEYFREVINPAFQELEGSVREGRPLGIARIFGDGAGSFYEALGKSARYGDLFREAMAADTRLNRDRVAESPLFDQHRRILDVGGNEGELAMAIHAHHPRARITVLDFPDVAARAGERFQAEGLSDWLDARGGDLVGHDLPTGYDAILFAHFLDIFSPDEVRRFLRRAHDALPDGGSVVVLGSVMSDDETGPLMYGVLSSYFLCLAGGEGRFYTAKQTEEAMREAGFVDIERTPLPRSEVLLRGRKRAGGRTGKLAAVVRLLRPKFLVYSLLLYGLGSATAVTRGQPIDLARWSLGLAFVWCAHLMTHAVNERFDLAADAENLTPTRWTGGSRVLVEGRLAPSAALGAAMALLLASLALGLAMPGKGILPLALIVVGLGWAYTAPPLALNYRGLGEITVALTLCVLVPLLGESLQRGAVDPSPLLLGAALPISVAQAARMLVMNLSDHEGDRLAGKRTLAVLLGPRRARWAFAAGQLVAYGSIGALGALSVLPPAATAAMLATLPISAWLVRRLLSGAPRDPAEANAIAFWASTHVAVLAAAASAALLVAAPIHGTTGASLAGSIGFSAAVVIVFVMLLGVQIHHMRLEESR